MAAASTPIERSVCATALAATVGRGEPSLRGFEITGSAFQSGHSASARSPLRGFLYLTRQRQVSLLQPIPLADEDRDRALSTRPGRPAEPRFIRDDLYVKDRNTALGGSPGLRRVPELSRFVWHVTNKMFTELWKYGQNYSSQPSGFHKPRSFTLLSRLPGRRDERLRERFPVPGHADSPTVGPGGRGFHGPQGFPSSVAGTVFAGQVGCWRAWMRFQAVMIAAAQGQDAAIFRVLRRPPRTSLAAAWKIR
jgi:hypothetical protein